MHCFAHVHRRRKPSAPGAFCTVLLMEQVAKATCIFVQKALKWPKSLVAHVAIATCASAKRPLQARVRWHDASQVAWSLLPGTISLTVVGVVVELDPAMLSHLAVRRFLVTDGRVCGRDVRSSEGVWGRREPSKVHSRLHRLHEFVQRLNHCSPAVAGSARSAMQNGGGGLAGAPSGLAESPGIRLTRDLRRAFPTMRPRSA